MDKQTVLECRFIHIFSISEIYEIVLDYSFNPHAHFALAVV